MSTVFRLMTIHTGTHNAMKFMSEQTDTNKMITHKMIPRVIVKFRPESIGPPPSLNDIANAVF
ncbi:hypothetical protein Xhom_04604 [Xenorhabdus hominickii]|uniref:Uncharacterized protein n=1 Tax=Xenorhabdus hominickii TaxID=351679 RepID=A0A2G0PZ30_XENHO|nr:hypothetical protein Xhom_04604 [Xenorhabdus hominickii]